VLRGGRWSRGKWKGVDRSVEVVFGGCVWKSWKRQMWVLHFMVGAVKKAVLLERYDVCLYMRLMPTSVPLEALQHPERTQS
jgi:hypothetical protein